LELQMHSAVLRFTFCDEVQCPRVSRYLAACTGLAIAGIRCYWRGVHDVDEVEHRQDD